MGYDLKRSHFSLVLEKVVQAGQVITEEGLLLASVLDAATGSEVVLPTTGSGDIVAGFAIRDNADHATTSEVESVTVPATAPYEVQLRNGNLVGVSGDGATASLSAIRDNGTQMTLSNDTSSGVNDIGVQSSPALTGLLAFDAARAGETVVVTYRYNLTVAESRLKFFQRNINNEASTLFGQVGVGQGHGEVFTDMFDGTVDWSAATSIKAGADGIVEDQGGSGTIIDARVISVPNVNNPLLGLSFDIGGATT
jgi:hypothetical protein